MCALPQIISCFFSVVEDFCPERDELEESFGYTLQTAQFQLPKVRFEYDVSPPPPPPVKLDMYEQLLEADPHGFARVRNELDSLFPSLNHVATSSMGASIKKHIADYHMPPEMITRAFLSSAGMEKDSLGARVIESKHTGRWRYACLELFNFLKDYTSPGKASKAYKTGYEEQRVDHLSEWDRNAFLYAMIEVELGMGHGRDMSRLNDDWDGDGTLTALEMYDEICGFGNGDADGPAGWRVAHKTIEGTPANEAGFYATPDKYFPLYGTNASEWPHVNAEDMVYPPITHFAPIVAYGSLETLQSMRMAELDACHDGFATDDAEVALACLGDETDHVNRFKRALEERADHSPFVMQRDVWCNPNAEMSVESTVGNPGMHQLDLYDTPRKKGLFVDHLKVDANDRGEEFIDGTYKQYNLQSWVFVTSSGDPNLRAGMYRLSDLPVFRTTPCAELPRVKCSKDEEVKIRIDHKLDSWQVRMFYFYNIKLPVEYEFGVWRTTLQKDVPLIDAAGTSNHSSFVTGRAGIVLHRCSDQVADGINFYGCIKKPYTDKKAGCYKGDLELLSDPTLYGTSSHYYDRLGPAPLPPTPPPPPAPNPPPPPPSPSPLPSPPRLYDPDEIKSQIRAAEERVCTSVYYLSQTTRCEQLALDLTQRLLINWSPPPTPPPAAPIAPRLPPPPPSPLMPSGMDLVQLNSVTLSTMRMPLLRLNDADTVDGYFTANSSLSTAIGAESMGTRACVTTSSPLGCITATLPERCLNGERRCGTVDENGLNPTLDAYFKVPASYYVWGVRMSLPQNQQLAELVVGTTKLELYGPGATPIPCHEGNNDIVGAPLNRQIDVICQAPTATDDDIRRLATVERLRLTLSGQYRQIWLASVQPIIRLLAAAEVGKAPPPPPNLSPRPPPSPPEPDNADCEWEPGFHLVNREAVLESNVTATHEPCGLDETKCCNHAGEQGAKAFDIDDSGCCTLLYYDAKPAVEESTVLTGRWSAKAGFGEVK